MKASKYLKSGEVIAKKLNNREGKGRVYALRSMLHYQAGDFMSSLSTADSAISIFVATKNNARLIYAYNAKAKSLTQLSRYTTSIDYLHKILKLSESIGDERQTAIALGNIGVIHIKLKNYRKGIEYYEKALDIFLKLNDELKVGTAYANIGSAYLELKDYPKSIAYNEKALFISRKLQTNKGIANSLMDIGISYGHTGYYRKGWDFLNQASTLYLEMETYNNYSNALHHMSDLILRLPDSLLSLIPEKEGNRYDKALVYQNKAIAFARKSKDLELLSNQLESLYFILEQKGDLKRALSSYKEFILIRDSVFNNNKIKELALKEASFENEKKTAVLKAAHAAEIRQQKITRNFIIIVFVILMLIQPPNNRTS